MPSIKLLKRELLAVVHVPATPKFYGELYLVPATQTRQGAGELGRKLSDYIHDVFRRKRYYAPSGHPSRGIENHPLEYLRTKHYACFTYDFSRHHKRLINGLLKQMIDRGFYVQTHHNFFKGRVRH